MRGVIQRVNHATIRVENTVVGHIKKGLLVFLGIEKTDEDKDLNYLIEKILSLRIFEDEESKMNLSVKDVDGSILVVSQFTLFGDCRKGRRPSFTHAATPDMAVRYYNEFIEGIKKMGLHVEEGLFQAHMCVESENDGPVTLMLDSKKTF